MTDLEKNKTVLPESDVLTTAASGPLVFISHDSRDGDLAEAFSKLLKSGTAGMLKSFRSSDKKGTEGIDFGDEWYRKLMARLQSASDVVCLFTERSVDRPWILYEAGVAKGKLNTPVHGIALGIPLSHVSTGPFYQFHNCEDSEEDLTKLVLQLARRIPGLEPDTDVVKNQVKIFKATADKLLEKLSGHNGKRDKHDADENPMAKLMEEMKALVRDLPSRVAERMTEAGDPRRRRVRRFHPMLLEEMLHITGDSSDPIGILIVASLIRDDAPWLYEIAMEAYRAIKSGDPIEIKREVSRMQRTTEFTMRSPMMEDFGISNKETHIFLMEFQRVLQHILSRSLEEKKPNRRRLPTELPLSNPNSS